MDDLSTHMLTMAARLAETVSGRDLDGTLQALTRAAVEVLPGVDEASITIRHTDGSIRSYAVTAPFLSELDNWQFARAEGPCYDGVTRNALSVCSDLGADPRYPHYGKQAVAAGIRSQAGLRIFETKHFVGGLNVYSRRVGDLGDIAFLAELFGAHARSAMAYALEIDGLRDAVSSRQLVGQAVGIVMERFALSGEQAFAFLTRLSSERNVKLRTLAEQLVAAAAPEERARP